uniref:CDP-diacylglycerol--inositol 3-phosphatidyltransferase n=2 Tax=Lepeophtheirus salmonis TaxID=72036 RepID=A0A0K2U665_LEPSM
MTEPQQNTLHSLSLTKNVFLYVPNIIGYLRILFLLIAIATMQSYYTVCSFCYGLSVALDMVDGFAARTFNQSSRFGALLDMLTDRCGTMALLHTLGIFYPSYSFFFSLSSIIDISMHWIHCHVSVVKGQISHKTGLKDSTITPFILRYYYENKPFLTFMCFINEVFYSSLYMSHFTTGRFYIFYILSVVAFPFAMFKSVLALLQGYVAAMKVVEIDIKERHTQ